MNYPHNKISRFLFAAILLLSTGVSFAEEVLQEDSVIENDRDGYYLSIGAGYRNHESPLRDIDDGFQVVFKGRYQWHGAFVEIGSDPSSEKSLPAIGYNFYNTDHWNFDLIAAITDGGGRVSYEIEGETKYVSSDQTRGAGFRALGSWGDTMLQLVALPYINEDLRSDSAIDYASLWVGHRWQIKNWSLNGLVGAKYRSSGLLDYHFGITEGSEANAVLDAYQPGSGVDYTAQIDLTYPVSKNLLFQIYTRHTTYSDEILNSPIIKGVRQFHGRPEKEQEFGILFNYVF